jgi:hypothetical protein
MKAVPVLINVHVRGIQQYGFGEKAVGGTKKAVAQR